MPVSAPAKYRLYAVCSVRHEAEIPDRDIMAGCAKLRTILAYGMLVDVVALSCGRRKRRPLVESDIHIEREFAMKYGRFILPFLALGFFASAYAADNLGSAPVKIDKIDGTISNLKGMTLYTFDKDTGDKSACNGTCAENWRPLTAEANEVMGAEFKVITRDDGGKQWTFKGKPLYTYAKDQKPGDKTGDKFNGVWHVAHFPIDR
jgi:predicted lipoprotein with Yx(FWY)xxD motif